MEGNGLLRQGRGDGGRLVGSGLGDGLQPDGVICDGCCSGVRLCDGGSFPLVNAPDVQVSEDGTRLDAVLAKITEVQSVDALPENPDPTVLYLIREEG